jgi:predicted nucleotide-binding protein
VIDSDFEKGLPHNGKVAIVGSEYDYTAEVRAIASKLKMWLTVHADQRGADVHPLKAKVDEFIKRGEEVQSAEFHPAINGCLFSYVSGPRFDAWMKEIKIFTDRHLAGHPLQNDMLKTYQNYGKNSSSCEDMLGNLRALASDDEFFQSIMLRSGDDFKTETEVTQSGMSNKVFIVHGHDDTAKEKVARFLEKDGFEVVILHEQPNAGRTIIEKIETYTDVAYGVVLYTPCDKGRAKEESVKNEANRARQNVVFEHGYLIAKLGRERVCALVKADVETPGDISGVVYIRMDDGEAWKIELAREMKNAGLSVDANKFI